MDPAQGDCRRSKPATPYTASENEPLVLKYFWERAASPWFLLGQISWNPGWVCFFFLKFYSPFTGIIKVVLKIG